MSLSTGKPDSEARFSFGSMALSEETGRQPPPATASAGLSDEAPELNEAIDILRMNSLNEHFAPEILPFQDSMCAVVRALVTEQTDAVDAEEDAGVDALSFESQLKRMEIDRANYMLRCYYRDRVKKVEDGIMHVFRDTKVYDLLSKEEQTFAVGYSNLVEDHFNKSFLEMLPKRVRIYEKDGDADHATGPNLNRFVFCRMRNSVGSYAVGDGPTDDFLDLQRGDIICVRYKSIQQLLLKEDVELI